jgi:hypothetical protein
MEQVAGYPEEYDGTVSHVRGKYQVVKQSFRVSGASSFL